MKLLLIEDDPHKSKQIYEFVRNNKPYCYIQVCHSFQSGLKAAFQQSFDVVLLDMSLPTFDIKSGEGGYKFLKRAGEDILREFKRKKYPAKVIVVTQFDTFGEGEDYIELSDLKKQLEYNYNQNYIGTVYYDASQLKWKIELEELLEKTLNIF